MTNIKSEKWKVNLLQKISSNKTLELVPCHPQALWRLRKHRCSLSEETKISAARNESRFLGRKKQGPTCSPICSLRPVPICHTQQRNSSRNHCFTETRMERLSLKTMVFEFPGKSPKETDSKAIGISAAQTEETRLPWQQVPPPDPHPVLQPAGAPAIGVLTVLHSVWTPWRRNLL